MADWKHKFDIPRNMMQYADTTIARLSFLWPDVAFELLGTNIIASAAVEQNMTNLKRDLRYGLYREKIQSEHKELKESLYRAVFR